MSDLHNITRGSAIHAFLDEFKSRVEAFLAETGMSKSRFGDLAANDRSLVDDMRDGKREFKLSTMRKVDLWMDTYRTDPVAATGGDPDTGRAA